MGRHPRLPTITTPPAQHPLPSPFGSIDGLDHRDFCEAAYEVFFTACRSSPGFGGRTAISYHSNSDGETSPLKRPGVGMAVTSRIKRALGLKMVKKPPQSRRSSSCGSNPLSPGAFAPGSGSSPKLVSTISHVGRVRRPMTSAEIMRQQMKVSEQSDNRLRKTLMRTLVGQMGRRAETLILPLELLRHLKPSEFNDPHEYHLWQQRQLKILEAGLLLHPAIPLDKSDTFAAKLREIINTSETNVIDTGKNSATMRTLCNCIVALAWRSPDGGSTDVCHWADGYPLNVHIYTALLSSIFDMKEETLVLDEVDELVELMKKTWSTLGINRSIHNLCFSWVLFERYVMTEQTANEGALDLLGASYVMLTEVANDAKKGDREPVYMKMLAGVLVSMKKWCERRLLDYHGNFSTTTIGVMENMLPLLFSATKILEEDVPSYVSFSQETDNELSGNRVDCYIRSSVRNAFAKMLEELNVNGAKYNKAPEVSDLLIKLANKTEELAAKEKEIFTPLLKKWHPVAAGVASVTLHTCYGTLLKQYLAVSSSFSNETVVALQRARKLEKSLVQLVVEDSVECEDGGKAIVMEMVPYEVDAMVLKLQKEWLQEKLQKGKELLLRAKQTENWNPKSKTEPYAQSAVELVVFAKEVIDSFFDIQVGVSESLFNDFVAGLEGIFKDYIAFISSCGSKNSYLPTLPPLTRCSRDSKLSKFWRIGCSTGIHGIHNSNHVSAVHDSNNPRPSTSRGTQRLYIRLNTLQYLVSQLNSLNKTLSLPSTEACTRRKFRGSYFEQSLSAIQSVSQHVAEVSAYRLIFLDCNFVLHGSLYAGGVANARITPAVKLLKQNLTLLCAIVTERAQTGALREVMKASFEAFMMVLLAGGMSRMFTRMDHGMIEEDLESLKEVFSACGDGLLVEEMVEKESEAAEGVVGLMGETAEQLIEDLSSSMGGLEMGRQKVALPEMAGKWERTDPETILRVLCCRNDRVGNYFLKKMFHLPKRRPVISMA